MFCQYSEFCVRNYYVGQELAGSYEDYEDVDWIYTTNVRGPKCKAKHLMKTPVQVEEVGRWKGFILVDFIHTMYIS